MRLNKKILFGLIAVHVALAAAAAVFFLMRRPGPGLTDGGQLASAVLPAAALALVLFVSGLVSGLILKSLSSRLGPLVHVLGGGAQSLETAAGRLGGTARALAEASARNSAALEEAASALSQASSLIMRGLDDVSKTSEVADFLGKISELIGLAGESLGEADKARRQGSCVSEEIGLEAAQLSGRADELLEAVNNLSAFIYGTGGPFNERASSPKNKSAALVVKALPHQSRALDQQMLRVCP